MTTKTKAARSFNRALSDLEQSLIGMNTALLTGVEHLRRVDAYLRESRKLAQDYARETVTDDMVREFTEKTLMNHSDARDILEAAHVDYLLNAERTEDEQE